MRHFKTVRVLDVEAQSILCDVISGMKETRISSSFNAVSDNSISFVPSSGFVADSTTGTWRLKTFSSFYPTQTKHFLCGSF